MCPTNIKSDNVHTRKRQFSSRTNFCLLPYDTQPIKTTSTNGFWEAKLDPSFGNNKKKRKEKCICLCEACALQVFLPHFFDKTRSWVCKSFLFRRGTMGKKFSSPTYSQPSTFWFGPELDDTTTNLTKRESARDMCGADQDQARGDPDKKRNDPINSHGTAKSHEISNQNGWQLKNTPTRDTPTHVWFLGWGLRKWEVSGKSFAHPQLSVRFLIFATWFPHVWASSGSFRRISQRRLLAAKINLMSDTLTDATTHSEGEQHTPCDHVVPSGTKWEKLFPTLLGLMPKKEESWCEN